MFSKTNKTNTEYAPIAEREQAMLANLSRGTVIGDFVAICRTDYVQPYYDEWINVFEYRWTEWLLLVKDLLESPNNLDHLVYLPEDMAEVYLVQIPAQTPDLRYLTPKGRHDYELYPGYEEAVNRELIKDYAVNFSRSVFHSVDPQTGDWNTIIDQALSGDFNNIDLEFNGITYKYSFPSGDDAASAMSATFATRRGGYPAEQSLKANQRYDIVPAIPDGQTGQIWIREYLADPKQNPPFEILSFQCTKMPQDKIGPNEPPVHYNVSLGNMLAYETSVADYLARKYVQMGLRSPDVRFKSVY